MEKQIKVGDKLTVKNDIISYGGMVFEKGQTVTVRAVNKRAAYWSRFFQCWEPEVITGVKLIEHSGDWQLDVFSY